MLSIWGMLTLSQSPVPADVTTKLFSEPLFSSQTVVQLQAFVSPDSLCCCSSPGPFLFQLCALQSLSLCVCLDRQTQLPYGVTLSVFWEPVLSPRVFFTTQLELVGPEFPGRTFPRNHHFQDSAWCIYLYYPSKPATLRAFCKLDVS